jgi:hypothetical protein
MRNKKYNNSLNFIDAFSILSLFALIAIVSVAIENNLKKETLENKLLMVSLYIIGFIIIHYITKMFCKYVVEVKSLHFVCLFMWSFTSVIKIFRMFIF